MRPAWAPAAAAAVTTSSAWATSAHQQQELPAVLENTSSAFLPTESSWNRNGTYNSTRGLGTTSSRNLAIANGGFDDEADLWQAMRVVAGVVAVLLCLSIAGAAFHRRHKLQRRIEEMRKRYLPPTMEILEAESKGRPHPYTSPHASASLDRRIRNWIASVPYGPGGSANRPAAVIPTIAGRVSPPVIDEDSEVVVIVREAPSPAPLSSSPPRSPTEPQDSLPNAHPLDTRDLVVDSATDAGRYPTLNAFCTLPWVGRFSRSEVRT